ncbi:MAG: acetate--CoA ligase family protein [Alphaproteobacteria bacterium]|nr:acetate--CoA ligase family protein [Alphaproteobacteria bacterium]
MSADPVEALLHPRNIVLVGASDRPRHWSGRIRANLARFGFKGGVYALNPGRDEIWGEPCFADLDALPEPPDHIISFVPADAVFDVLRQAAAAGARSALVFAGGFGEGDDEEGRARARKLRQVIAETGLAVCGPNCFGNVAAPSRMVTLPDDGLERIEAGPTAVIAQSGALVAALNRLLTERGLIPSYMVSAGNQVGLGAGDYIRFMTAQPQVKAILLYLEQVVHRQDFIAACGEAAAAGKGVVAVKIGGSEQGREAALAHTGALTGSLIAFDAVAGAEGVIRVDSMEDAVDALDYLVHTEPPKGDGIAVMTNSGALKSLVSEAGARAGISFASLSNATTEKIAAALGPLADAANPLDTHQTLKSEAHTACMDALAADPAVDLLLLAEELPLVPGIERKELNLAAIAQWAKKGGPVPMALFAPMAVRLSDHARALRAKLDHVAYLSEPDRTFRVLGRILDAQARRRRALTGSGAATGSADGPAHGPADRDAILAELTAFKADAPRALNEARSKSLLAHWGIAAPRETLTKDGAAAANAAQAIGFPVVVKAVSEDLPHKTEAGAIALGLTDATTVKKACAEITDSVARFDAKAHITGFLVAQQVLGGAEFALGIARDAELGAVVMFGTGGVMVELYKDVAFGRPGLTRAEAEAMIDATRAGDILAGFRGAPALDRGAVTDAIMALGQFAAHMGEIIEAVDINPLIARADGEGAVALDALVILRGK